MNPLKHCSYIAGKTLYKTAITTACTLSLLPAAPLIAADLDLSLNEITITDVNSDNVPPKALFTFTANGDTVEFNAAGSTDSDGDIIAYHWNFGDGSTATGAQVQHQFADNGPKSVTLTVIDNDNGVGISRQQFILQEPINLAINFQPENADIPEGYLPDSGKPYSDARGYGWIKPSYETFFDRNSDNAPDQSYDTLVHVYKDAIWEVAVPAGTYNVTVLVGDPAYPWAKNSIQVEGETLFNKAITSKNTTYFIEKSINIAVKDGHLTLSFRGSIPKTKLCNIVITNE